MEPYKQLAELAAKMRTAQIRLGKSKSNRNLKEAELAEKLVDQELARMAHCNPTIADELIKQR